MRLLLGIDDTDALGHRPGTGRLARELAADLEERGMCALVAVVRQQLLVDPRVPYTSHNSPACLVLDVPEGDGGLRARIAAEAASYVLARCAAGSDPGLCLAEQAAVVESAVRFGWRASCAVVGKAEAADVARRAGFVLEELGGSGDGVIGALAAVGLTAEGNAGRFLELAGGLRDLPERVEARVLVERGLTLLSIGRDAEPIPPEAIVSSDGRLRPRLVAGRPVLLLERNGDGWLCFDRGKRESGKGEP